MNEENSYKLHEFVAHSTQVNCITIGPQSIQVLATGGEDNKVNIWRIDTATNIWSLKQNKSPIECLCFDNEEQYICSGAMNGSLKIFDLNEGKLARNLRGHQVHVTSIHYHPYGEFIVSGSTDNSMKVWDIRNKSCVQTYTGHDREITCTRFSPDGRWVASSAKDGQLLLWDLVAGKLLNTLKLQQNAHFTTFEFNPCEFLLAGATSNRSVRFWDLEVMTEIGHTTPDSTTVRSICYAEEGTKLCTANNEMLRTWNWDPSVSLLHNYSIGWDRIQEMRSCNHNPSEHLIAVSSNSNFVSIWDVDVGYLNEQSISSIEVAEDRGIGLSRERSNSANRKSVGSNDRERNERNERNERGNNNSNNSYNIITGVGIQNSNNRPNSVNYSSDDEVDSSNLNPNNKPLLRVDGYFSSPDKKPVGGVLETVPEVQWEGGHSTNDLAVSISESKSRHDHLLNQQNQNTKRSQSNLSNQPVVITEDEERANHDRFVPSTNPRSRRPVTREKERENLNSRRGEKQKNDLNQGNTPEVGLSVVGLRPTTSSSSSSPSTLSDNVRDGYSNNSPPVQPSRYVVNNSDNNNNNNKRNEKNVIGTEIDRGESSQDKDRQRDSKNYRRIQSDNQITNPNYNEKAPVGIKRDSSLQSISSSSSSSNNNNNNNNNNVNNSASRYDEVVTISDEVKTQQEIDTYLTLIITKSELTSSLLMERYQTLQLLHSYWTNGEIEKICDTLHSLLSSYLSSQKDSTSFFTTVNLTPSSPTDTSYLIFSDFLNAVDFHSSTITLTSCCKFLCLFHEVFQSVNVFPIPFLQSLLSSINTLYSIFGPIILQNRAVIGVCGGMVDMAREERLEKCNLCSFYLLEIKNKLEMLREKYRKYLNVREAIEYTQQLLSELDMK